MKAKLFCLLCVVIAFLSACSPDLDRVEATNLFQTSPDIHQVLAEDFILYRNQNRPTAYLNACKMHDIIKLEASEEQSSWLLDAYWAFALTEEGKKLVAADVPSPDENKVYLRVCSLKVKEVTGILFLNEDKTKACIEYVLTFDDITKAGDMWNDFAFQYGDQNNLKLVPGRTVPFKALASKYDDGWRLVPPGEGKVGRTYSDWRKGQDWCQYE